MLQRAAALTVAWACLCLLKIACLVVAALLGWCAALGRLWWPMAEYCGMVRVWLGCGGCGGCGGCARHDVDNDQAASAVAVRSRVGWG